MFDTSAPSDVDLGSLLRLFGPAGGLGQPQPAQSVVSAVSGVPARSGMFGGANRQMAQAALPSPAPREPLNFGAPPPDDVFGTKPITSTIPIRDLAPDPRVAKALQPRPFDKGGRGWQILGILGDALATAGGAQPTYMPAMRERQRLAAEQQRWDAEQQMNRAKLAWEIRKDMRPDVRSVGRSVVSVPIEGDPKVLFTAPTDAEQYAANLGLNPGDDGYSDAIMDATLRGSGPTAFAQRRSLEDQRYGHRVDLRGVPTYANLHPRPAGGGSSNTGTPRPPRSVGEAVAGIVQKLARGEQLTPGEQGALALYNRRRTGMPTAPLPALPTALPGPASGASPVRVTSPDQARSLPPGTQFITPDGRVKVR